MPSAIMIYAHPKLGNYHQLCSLFRFLMYRYLDASGYYKIHVTGKNCSGLTETRSLDIDNTWVMLHRLYYQGTCRARSVTYIFTWCYLSKISTIHKKYHSIDTTVREVGYSNLSLRNLSVFVRRNLITYQWMITVKSA